MNSAAPPVVGLTGNDGSARHDAPPSSERWTKNLSAACSNVEPISVLVLYCAAATLTVWMLRLEKSRSQVRPSSLDSAMNKQFCVHLTIAPVT